MTPLPALLAVLGLAVLLFGVALGYAFPHAAFWRNHR